MQVNFPHPGIIMRSRSTATRHLLDKPYVPLLGTHDNFIYRSLSALLPYMYTVLGGCLTMRRDVEINDVNALLALICIPTERSEPSTTISHRVPLTYNNNNYAAVATREWFIPTLIRDDVETSMLSARYTMTAGLR